MAQCNATLFFCSPVAAVAAVLLLGAAPGTRAQAADNWSASVAVASDYVAHGLTRSQGDSVLQARVGLTRESGWSASVGASTLNLSAGPSVTREVNFYIGKSWDLSRDWDLSASAAYYAFARNSPRFPYDYSEAKLSLSYRGLLRASVSVSPDYSIFARGVPAREFTTLTSEIVANYPLTRALQLTAGVGYYDLSDGIGNGYFFWSAGATAQYQRVSLALTYVGTDSRSKRLFSQSFASDHWVVSAALRLH